MKNFQNEALPPPHSNSLKVRTYIMWVIKLTIANCLLSWTLCLCQVLNAAESLGKLQK